MYKLRITLRHPESREDSCWYHAVEFPTSKECYNYLESNNYNMEDPDGVYNYEIFTPQNDCISL
jgi:hypothetical protein